MEEKNSEKKYDNPKAYPLSYDKREGHHTYPVINSGMSLRDYFAGQVLTGISAAFYGSEPATKTMGSISDKKGVTPNELMASAAYQMAEAMLKERSKYE